MAINPSDLNATLDILYSNEALLCQYFKLHADYLEGKEPKSPSLTKRTYIAILLMLHPQNQ